MGFLIGVFLLASPHPSNHERHASIPVFGTFASGEPFFDAAASNVRPREILKQPGNLRGHWTSAKFASILTITANPPTAKQKKDFPLLFAFPEDHFVVAVPGLEPLNFTATYGTFAAYPLDVNGDAQEELAIEYGDGRGTDAYVRHLAIFEVSANHFLPILDIALNGYLDVQSIKGDPPAWKRYYALHRERNRVDVRLSLVEPEFVPKYLGDVQLTEPLQFTSLTYRYNRARRTYELHRFVFRQLP